MINYPGIIIGFCFLFQLGFGTFTHAQFEISGIVKDQVSFNPINGANVFLKENNKGTSTNASGYFQIENLTPGNYQIQVSYIGYKDTSLQINTLQSQHLTILLKPDSIEMAAIVVTATRTPALMEDVPERVYRIDKKTIENYPASNTDNILRMIPGINVNRSSGIFSRNSSVTMRGMPGASRSLILLNGVPLNKSAGGTINWHLVTPDEIDRIEIVKGPGSALYGNNAMSGVINIITRKPRKKIEGMINAGYGSYNTFKTLAFLNGSNIKDSKGIYWRFGGFYRQGDGYIIEPEDTRDSLNVNAFLKEGNLNALLGYQFGPDQKLEIDYRYYNDSRGNGVQVYEKDGSYENFTDHNLRAGFEGNIKQTKINIKAFYFKEGYYRQNENINKSGEYKLVDTETDKIDMGLWMTLSRTLEKKHLLTAGIDFKNGRLDNQEIYRTSPDITYTEGKIIFSALFLQDEMDLAADKLKLIAGLRFDYAMYYDGNFEVVNPTDKTGFTESDAISYPTSGWLEVSPKLALKYFLTKSFNAFISASTGFMPPKLDDLAGSRKISRGFKIANPELLPENITSFELGLDYSLAEKLFIKSSGYYSLGNDFQYLVATGDYLDPNSDEPIPVYQRQNVSKVRIIGTELGVDYFITKKIKFTGSYAYNYSKIVAYNSSYGESLDGKYLNEVPPNLVFLGLQWQNKIVDVFIDYAYTDYQWYDEFNTILVDSYSLVNIRLSKYVIKNLQLVLDIQDLLDEQFVDRKGYLSPGRYIMFEVKYFIN
jgi:iron complex outermembrane recepter protein